MELLALLCVATLALLPRIRGLRRDRYEEWLATTRDLLSRAETDPAIFDSPRVYSGPSLLVRTKEKPWAVRAVEAGELKWAFNNQGWVALPDVSLPSRESIDVETRVDTGATALGPGPTTQPLTIGWGLGSHVPGKKNDNELN